MSDNLDLDQLFEKMGDESTNLNNLTKTLQGQVDKSEFGVSDVLSKTAQTLETMTSDVDVDKIVNATNDSALADAKAFGTNLAGVMVDLQKILDSIGHGFDGVRDLNTQEQGWIDGAKSALENAEKALEAIKIKPKAWWQKLFGLDNKSKIEESMKLVTKANAFVETETARAQEHHQSRLENEPLGEQLKRMIKIVTLITNHVQTKMGAIDVELEKIKISQEGAFKIKEQASGLMEKYSAETEELKQGLNTENEVLNELDPASPQYATQQKVIEGISQEITEITGKFEVARSVFNSKERFVDLHAIAIEALETQRKNLKADIAALKSDTIERESFYAGTIESLRAAAYIKVTSTFEKAGVETDKKSAQMLAAAAVGSQNSRIERIEAQESRVQDVDEVIKALMGKQREFARRSEEANQKMSDHYGIDLEGNRITDSDPSGSSSSDLPDTDGPVSPGKSVNDELLDAMG